MSECGIPDGGEVTARSGRDVVFVKTGGRTLAVPVAADAATTVEAVQRYLQQHHGVTTTTQVLTWHQHVLEAQCTLASYGVTVDATLELEPVQATGSASPTCTRAARGGTPSRAVTRGTSVQGV